MTIVQAIPLFAVLAAAPAVYAGETSAVDQAGDFAKSTKDSAVDTANDKVINPAKDSALNPAKDSAKDDDAAKSDDLMPMATTTPAAMPSSCPVVRVHFATDSADIPADDQAQLNEAAGCLKKNERLQVTVEGNTDERGTAEHNQGLSERRAAAVAQYLEGQGIASAQLKTAAFGEEKPVCNDHGEGCWSKNRRTAIRPACHL